MNDEPSSHTPTRERPTLSSNAALIPTGENESTPTADTRDCDRLELCVSSFSVPVPDPSSLYLAPDPSKKSHAKRKPAGHIPRPKNAFILFRCDLVRQKRIPAELQADHKDISRIAGMMWKSLSSKQKKPWMDMAKMEKKLHLLKYPNYAYKSGSGSGGRQSFIGDSEKEKRCKDKGQRNRGRRNDGRSVKTEDTCDLGTLLTFETELPTGAFQPPNITHSPPVKQPDGLHDSFPTIDYNMYRRSSSCPPPQSYPVYGNRTDMPSGDRFAPASSDMTRTTVGRTDEGLNIRTSRDDISQSRRPSRVATYHSISETYHGHDKEGYYLYNQMPNFLSPLPSSAQAPNQMQKATVHQMQIPIIQPLPEPVDLEEQSPSQEIDWTFPWSSSFVPDNLVSGLHMPRDVPTWDAMRWELAGNRNRFFGKNTMVQGSEHPISPRTVIGRRNVDWSENRGCVNTGEASTHLNTPSRIHGPAYPFPRMAYQNEYSPLALDSYGVPETSISGRKEITNDLGLLFPRLSLDETMSDGPSLPLLPSHSPPPSTENKFSSVSSTLKHPEYDNQSRNKEAHSRSTPREMSTPVTRRFAD
ncbi:hypothetical protein VKT23_019538 [Stygiomarasmius scandens]|uniref:HMG box domain-containing protein n=1 Tax=Marasmiellus scandens TaxID=2682957 RepID=A0ABR1IP79_9AGAR